MSEMKQGKFNILFLDPIAGLKDVNEIDWGIKGICTVQVPSYGPNDDTMWDYVYNGLTLTKTYSGTDFDSYIAIFFKLLKH
ncbi:hypothetical protein [Peribacillus frigoritolerans]|uniref:hypothetical protein n=1 Tax=Peribacillus frigoritolerans TaxID=450367 RepID=UPI002E1E9024|nr:hypothetical protein [Peribacillus frigoritolerans]MED3849497.1 hypothetical protein [Peribacillus frigoritolerans]